MARKRQAKMVLQPYQDDWHKPLASALISIFIDSIYRPLEKATRGSDRRDNAQVSALESALRKGSIQFTGGTFKGKINAAISKEIKRLGGKFTKGFWRIASPSLPIVLQQAIADNVAEMKALEKMVNKAFIGMPERALAMVKNMDVKSMGLVGLVRVSQDFKTQLQKTMAVMPKLEKQSLENLRKNYFETRDKPIKEHLLSEYEEGMAPACRDFAYETVAKLRKDLDGQILGGYSRLDIRDYISKNLGISKTRAKFIARQETALLTVEFKKQQCKEIQVEKYEWMTMQDHIVRGYNATRKDRGKANHKVLEGKIFSWDNPPSADHFSTGTPCHPGEDYNCRCQTIPIVEW